MNSGYMRGIAAGAAFMMLAAASAIADKPNAPKITSITSPRAGTITITIKRLKAFDNGFSKDAFPSFLFFRADGDVKRPELFAQFNPHPDPGDTVDFAGYISGITISGLRSGEQSFFVKVGYYVRDVGMVYSDPSNIETLVVQGTNTADGNLIYNYSRSTDEAAVAVVQEAGAFPAFPNPTRSLTYVPAPLPTGDATFVVYDSRGELAMTGSAMISERRCLVDAAGLPAGTYTAIVRQGLRAVRSAFTVVR